MGDRWIRLSYQTAFGLTAYVLGCLGLFRVLRTTVKFFSVGLAIVGLVTIWASSFLVWYMVAEPSMPHAASFAFTSFFLCFWLDRRLIDSRADWVGLGTLAGVAALVRWQNVVLLAVPVIDRALDSPRVAVRSWWTVAAAAICFTPQLLFWHFTSGGALSVPFSGHGFQVLWWRERKRLAGLCLLSFLLQVLVNSNVSIWWAGWSFGGRQFDSCVLFLAPQLSCSKTRNGYRMDRVRPVNSSSLMSIGGFPKLAHGV